jgi:hypothetical protein
MIDRSAKGSAGDAWRVKQEPWGDRVGRSGQSNVKIPSPGLGEGTGERNCRGERLFEIVVTCDRVSCESDEPLRAIGLVAG